MTTIKKISIAVIVPGLGRVNRGTETAFTAYLRELAKKDDLAVTVFGAGKNFSMPNVRYVRIPCPPRQWFTAFPAFRRVHLKYNHSYESLFFALLLTSIMLWYRIDLVFYSDFPFTLLPIWLYRTLRNRNVKIVFNPGGGTAFFYSRFFYADAVTATDPLWQEFFSKKFKSVLILPGVDHTLFHPRPGARVALGLPEDALVIFSASAFDPIKRIDFLIKAAGNMHNVFLLLSSNGMQREYLEKLGKELLGDNIKFLGFIDKNMLAQCYAAADVFCLPSITEAFGLVLIEAMASGTPVVTNNSQTQRWIVGDGGSCINVESEEALIAALEQYRDPAYRRHTSQLAQQNAQRFSWEKAGEQYYQLFRSLVQ